MSYFTVFDKQSGRIFRTGICQDALIKAQSNRESESVISKMSDGLFDYVCTESLTIKKRRSYSIDLLPTPSTVIIEGIEYRVTEQPVFEFDTPGTYIIKVIPDDVQYLEKEFEYVVET